MSTRTRKVCAALVAGAFALTGLAACSSDSADDGKGSVYYLNGKPEQDAAFQKIAKEYTQKTGVPVKIVTAASNTNEQTLKSEISKKDAPTMFGINGPMGLKTWQKYAADLTDTKWAKSIKDDNLALKGEDGKVYGLPLAVEGYGLIYNQDIFDKYFAMDGAKAKNMEEINNFQKLKEVADDMQAKKADLGIDGAFASTSLATGEDWRWQTHLSNIPMFYEYKDENITDTDNAKFKYNDEYKNIFDLYLKDSTVEPALTPNKTVTDSMSEFAQGKAAMVQNGNWAWSQIKDVSGNVVKEDKIKFMPIYTGHEGEEKQGLAIGTESFTAINAKASKADQKATQDFIEWLFTTDEGKKHVVEDLGFIAPYKDFTDRDIPTDPLAQQVAQSMNDTDKETITWVFTTYPSQQFKNDFGAALQQYASGNEKWDQVVKTFTDSWANEKSMLK